jgi:hypothetical protein
VWTRTASLLLSFFSIVSWSPVHAQTFDGYSSGSVRDFASLNSLESAPASSFAAGRAPRLRLFRMAPGFLSDPIGMVDEDSLAPLPGVQSMTSAPAAAPTQPDSGLDLIQFGMGIDNPYLDLRRPGDPGGVGFYRVNTQVKLFDSPRTACTLGLQAVTPAGIQFAGAPDGATVVSPAFSVFHTVGESTAIQAFLAKNVPLSNGECGCLQRNLQYGMAVQRPIVADGPDGLRSVFLSVGALGQLRPERDNLRLVPSCDVLPGLHWHVNDNWWLSSAVLLPVGPVHAAPSQWQLTCSFQF